MRKVTQPDSGHLYAMKVLKKATLKGEYFPSSKLALGGGRSPGHRLVHPMREVPLISGVSDIEVESKPTLSCLCPSPPKTKEKPGPRRK